MSGFSDYLCDFMKRSDISIADLAKETNIDRTVLYRYTKGSRIPSDVKIVVRIADNLQLSVRESRQLLEEYDKLLLGEDIVYGFQNISKLLHSLSRANKEKSEQRYWQAVRELKMDVPFIELNTREEIAAYIIDLFQYANGRSQDYSELYLIMQPIYGEVQKFLFYIFQESGISVEQIVCLEQNADQSDMNMQILQQILPLCFEMINYKVFYYYDSIANHINGTSNMPNLIILGDYAIQFDYDMKHGLVVHNDIYVGTIRKHYNTVRLNAQELLVERMEIDSASFHLESQLGKKTGEDDFGLSHDNVCLSTKLFEQEAFLSFEQEMIIKQMIDMAKRNHISYRFSPDENNLPIDLQLSWQKKQKNFAINRVAKNCILRVMLDESCACRMFQLYLTYMEKKGGLYNKEKSLQFLEKKLLVFRGRL